MEPAFANPPADFAVAFRAIMEVMARPGTVRDVAAPAPEGLSPAAAAVLLVLADPTTPVWTERGPRLARLPYRRARRAGPRRGDLRGRHLG